MAGESLKFGIPLVAGLAVVAHIQHNSINAGQEAIHRRVAQAVSDGVISPVVILRDNSAISLRQPSQDEENKARELAVAGQRNIGNMEFPEYPKITLSIRVAGYEACQVRVEQRILSSLTSQHPEHFNDSTLIEVISDLCRIDRNEVGRRFGVSDYSATFGR